MALEEVKMEIEVQNPKKKKKLASMKKIEVKKTTTGVPYPFRTEAEKVAYGKNMERITKPGYGEMGYKARPMSEMSEMAKPTVVPKKKL